MSRILIVEDEQHLAEGLRFNLEAEGHIAQTTGTGEAALDRLASEPGIDLVVLDVMLPGRDGFSVATELRQQGRLLPILMLTARGHAQDVLRGFAAGADDYLAKPFDLDIFLARVNGLLRRWDWMQQNRAAAAAAAVPAANDCYEFAGRVIDFDQLELRHGTRHLSLTAMEARFLRYLVQHEGRTVSRRAILEEVWEVHEDTDTRAIDNFIVRLRRYLEDEPSAPKHLLTVRGVGYRFVATPEASEPG
jgi:two-component system, OmpR family, alkaline phosphatase synthesis response regulator PhoP